MTRFPTTTVLAYAAAIAVVLGATGCDGGRTSLRRGVLADVALPDTVTAGEAFAISIRTYGGGCDRKGPTRVAVSGDRAVVEPFDLGVVPGSGEACPAVALTFHHQPLLEFGSSGRATIVVRGRRADRRPASGIVEIEHEVVVLPRTGGSL